ncbi:unnamed protein product [Lactuca saligna]|uniref:Uncharacterized protein n=1 Tax=Lactuca saligna TaxID=75948 RepID=A0AA36E627_LACSI|nr:unnamed protein product [Lactuca saligna]
MPLESNQVEEDLEVNLFRILYPIPIRVNNTFGGSSVGSGSDDFYQKVVVKLGVHNDKEKQRAMKATSSLAGLLPVSGCFYHHLQKLNSILRTSQCRLELTAAEKDGFFSEINMAIARNHGLEVQFIGLSFLSHWCLNFLHHVIDYLKVFHFVYHHLIKPFPITTYFQELFIFFSHYVLYG